METVVAIALAARLFTITGAAAPGSPVAATAAVSPDTEAAPAGAARPDGQDTPADPILIAWSRDPAMAYGGLTLASVQRLGSRLLGSADAARQRPGLAAAWEFPFAAVLSIVTHEVNGHGGRGREFDLRPRYGFDLLRMSAYTGTTRMPKSRDEIVSISGAGTEADTVLAHRLLFDLARPGGAEASTLPLALFAKLDLTLYVASTARPDREHAADFLDQYREGNDIANYLVARQGQRRGLDLGDMWNQVADVDVDDPLLRKNADAARIAALWNVLDPALIGAVVEYAREHLAGGAPRVRVPMLELGAGTGLSAGTRAFLAPSYVTRYLDLYVRVPFGVGSFYVRDLDSSVARTWGWGGVFAFDRAGSRVAARLAADRWDEPRSAEHGDGAPGWNVSGEIRVPAGRRVGVLLNVGHKTTGFVPGRPVKAGTYAGAGVLFSLR